VYCRNRKAGFHRIFIARIEHSIRREGSDRQRQKSAEDFSLGATAVAAVGLCNSISFIVMLLYSAIRTGAGVLVSQAFGRNDLNYVSKVASLSLILSGVFGGFTTLPLVLYAGPVLKSIGAPDELHWDSVSDSRSGARLLLGHSSLTRCRPGDWLYEIKFDGYRALALSRRWFARLDTRNERGMIGCGTTDLELTDVGSVAFKLRIVLRYFQEFPKEFASH
jgi:hypothetical protein